MCVKCVLRPVVWCTFTLRAQDYFVRTNFFVRSRLRIWRLSSVTFDIFRVCERAYSIMTLSLLLHICMGPWKCDRNWPNWIGKQFDLRWWCKKCVCTDLCLYYIKVINGKSYVCIYCKLPMLWEWLEQLILYLYYYLWCCLITQMFSYTYRVSQDKNGHHLFLNLTTYHEQNLNL